MQSARTPLFVLALVVAVVTLFPAVGFGAKSNLPRMAPFFRAKPLHVVTNLHITERWASLFEEMKVKDYNLVRLADANFGAEDIRRATFFILVDREVGVLPDRLSFMLPENLRNAPPGENETVMAIKKTGKRFLFYISAANSAAAYTFVNENLRNDTANLMFYSERFAPKRCYMPWTPSAPEIIFPLGTVKATRPSIFLLAPPSRFVRHFDLQMEPAGKLQDRTKNEFSTDREEFRTDTGGWIAFDQQLSAARNYELEQWGVKLTPEQKSGGWTVYMYEPAYDVGADASYELRARQVMYSSTDGSRIEGEWSSVVAKVTVQVPPQPSNLEPATRVTTTEDVSELGPSYSPDGRFILYSADRTAFKLYEVYMCEASRPGAGATRVSVTNRGSADTNPTWGPVYVDGTNFVSFTRRADYGKGVSEQQVWCVGVPTPEHPAVPAGYTRITNFEQASYAPAWSPDGQTLAYVKDAERGGAEIWLASGTAGSKVLVQGISPAWSHDGKALYYSSNANGSWDIWRLDLETGQQTVITSDSGAEFSPNVNPTSGDVAYVSSAAGNFDIWVMAGGITRQLTQWLGQDLRPAWDPTGQEVVYSTTRFSGGGTYDLATLRPYATGVTPGTPAPTAGGTINLPVGNN